MCGLAGYLSLNNSPVNISFIKDMLRIQKHRGPNNSRVIICNRREKAILVLDNLMQVNNNYDCVMGFNRLSIRDLSSAGNQPMYNSDKTIVLSFNGEIYNSSQYKDILLQKGFRFRSTTDTEVILYLYEVYGIDKMLQMLNGMFAITILDLNKNTFYLSRDRFGIKPLYYYKQNDIILYSSEVKSFYCNEYFKKAIEETNIAESMVFGSIYGSETLLKNVYSIEPGEILEVREGITIKRKYYDVDEPKECKIKEEDCLRNLQRYLMGSIRSQLISDVPVGFQLSGGIDSSIITKVALNLNEIKQKQIHSISIIFKDQQFSEEKYIDTVCDGELLTSHKYVLSSDYFNSNISKASFHSDFPLIIPNTMGIYLLAQKAKEYFTVCLSGEGADEMFCGYHRFLYGNLIHKYYSILGNKYVSRIIPQLNTNQIIPNFTQYNSYDRLNNYILWSSSNLDILNYMNEYELCKCYEKRMEIIHKGSGTYLKRFQKYEIKTHLIGLLERQDKMCMAHSIENRVPYLDNLLLEFVRNIDSEMLTKTNVSSKLNARRSCKYILKKLALQYYNENFVYRSKSGFALPLKQFISSKGFKEKLYDQIFPNIRQNAFFNYNRILKNFDVKNESIEMNYETLWKIIAYDNWNSIFLNNGIQEYYQTSREL